MKLAKRRTTKLFRLLAAVVLATAAGPLAAEDVSEVRIENYQFLPHDVKIRPGGKVRWVNNEKRASHSVLFPGEGGLESERLMSGDSWERKFDKPGRYPYTCGPHPEMSGIVNVVE